MDLEDKPTELWAPVARQLFGPEHGGGEPPDLSSTPAAGGGEGPDTHPDLPQPEPEEHDTELMRPDDADTLEVPAHEAAMAVAEALEQQEHESTDEDRPATASGEYDADTIKMSAQEAAQAVAEAEEEIQQLAETVEVSGEEGAAARQLAEEERERRRFDPSATMVVDRPRNLPKLSHECRMCGRRVSRPVPRKLRGSMHGEGGFRCEKCNNVFCAAHVVRVSGLWESLFSGARFRCQLCLPEATSPD